MAKKKSASTTPAKKRVEKTEPIVNATTPDFLPASASPGGIPVTDSNENPCGDVAEATPNADPGPSVPNV